MRFGEILDSPGFHGRSGRPRVPRLLERHVLHGTAEGADLNAEGAVDYTPSNTTTVLRALFLLIESIS
jgi:hypothetical protein